ncbi:MAG: hypothetical protein JNL97_05615, partial [Verrucomicrobiales bacterium]|nr:hypothetical protein [Verrucomicrobiales bacterium]
MNTHEPVPADPPSSPLPKPRRRWWFYALWIFGSLFALALVAVLSLVLYWNHLVSTYTSTSPKQLPQVEANEEMLADLRRRWDAYALLFIRRREPIPPFELTGQELNLFLGSFGPLRKQAYAEVLQNQVRVQFSVPLGRTGNRGLEGRFLNGTALLNPVYTNGHLVVRVAKVDANNKPLPGWMFSRLQSVNWGEALNRRPEF